YHPVLAFLYGWALLLVIQTGGMAASAVTFARYALQGVPPGTSEKALATAALAALTIINCLGGRAGPAGPSGPMVLRIVAVPTLIGCGLVLHAPAAVAPAPAAAQRPLLFALGGALVPVLFSYGGWQTASFVAGEIQEPRRNLPRALLLGVFGVMALYVLVAVACVRGLGPAQLAQTDAPALDVMSRALGARGAALVSAGIALSTPGFLSQSILTGPRVYFAMAKDGVFFRLVGRLHPRTRAPVGAIALQGAMATAIALAGQYDSILSYVISIDLLFFGLTALALFRFRR